MRVVWIFGGTESARQQLERSLARKAGAKYLVRRADRIEDIPEGHFGNTGVTALVDAFHSELQGFEGVKALRASGFFGPIFLCGEPAPEVAATMLPQLDLSGFFPPFDRLDVGLVSGVIHAKLVFDGTVDLEWFLNPGGRSSIETIRTLKDFHSFCTKLATFVSRFGVDVQQLKKVLMGLTLPHVKTGGGTLSVEQPFTIQYGLDPTKVLLGLSSFSRGASWNVMRSETSQALSQLKNAQAPVSSLLPELHHVVRATENIVLFAGSARAPKEESDPVFLLTSLLFPNSSGAAGKSVGSGHYFCVASFVQATAELSDDEAIAPADGSSPSAAEPVAPELSASLPDSPSEIKQESVAMAEVAAPPESPPPSGLIENVDLNRILSEPKLVGDAPKSVPVAQKASTRLAVPPAATEKNVGSVSPVSGHGESLPPGEAERLKAVCTAMSNDIRRLMRERREPTTDRELREAKAELEEKVRRLIENIDKLNEQIAERDGQIETLRAQVESLRKAA